MTEVLLRMAEEWFLAAKYVRAYETAKTALSLDPFYGNECIHKYVAAFRVHVGALFRNEDGEIDWYKVLGINDHSVPTQVLVHRFSVTYKLIHPDHHSSAAAQGAIQLLGNAFEVLGDSGTRAAFHKRWNLPPFLEDPPDPSTSSSTSKVVVASAASKPKDTTPSSRSKFEDPSCDHSIPRSGMSSRSAATAAAMEPKETTASSRSKFEDRSHAHSIARSSMPFKSTAAPKVASAIKSKETTSSSRSKFEDRTRAHSVARSAAPFRNQERLRSLNNCSVSTFKRESGRSRPFASTRSIM